jgi:DNA helicase-2/ATP-dependent DNA helicase PcrA
MNSALKQELNDLSSEKIKVVESEKRFLRIVAGAGTGKTTTMAMRIVYLLSNGAKPEDIVAFTFTERAAQNMKSRIYEKVKKVKPELCNHLGKMFIGTIHAFCFQTLQDEFGFGNYEVLDENQEMAFLLRHGWELGLSPNSKLGLTKNYTENCSIFLRSVGVVFDELILIDNPKELREKSPDFFKEFEKYSGLLDGHRLLTFNRIIYLMIKKITENRRPIEHIKHLIVDEYQDINRAQEKLIDLLGQSASVYIVGDPRQCIYQWRGSTEDSFTRFTEIFKDVDTVNVSENWRSCSSVVNTANAFAKSLSSKYDDIRPKRPERGKVIKVAFQNEMKEAGVIVNTIKRIVEKEKLCDYSDIAILFRSVKTSADPFIEAMKRENVPFIVGGKVGLFKRDECQLVGRLFAWLDDNGFWKPDLYGRETIDGEDLLESSSELWENSFGNGSFPEKRLREWKRNFLDGHFKGLLTQAFQELLLILGFLNLDQKDKSHAAMMANLGRFNALLTDFQSSIVRGGDKFDFQKDIKNLCWFLSSYGLNSYEQQMPDDIRGVSAVQLLTVHQAKGLEWLAIFIPSLTNRRFPSGNVGRKQNWLVSKDLFPVERYEGDIDDEKRLFYVAVTRARDFLCLSYFTQMSKSNYPMTETDFLKPLSLQVLPDENIEVEKLKKVLKDDEIHTFTGGEIIEYGRCPYFYRLRHVWNYQSQFSPMLGFGKSLHHVLRITCEKMKREKISPKEALESVFDDEFHLPYAPLDIRDRAIESARKTLENYVIKHENDIKNFEEVEARLEFPLQRSTIVGKIDVIIGPESSLQVRDYKTSEEVTSVEEAEMQVRLYTLGLNITWKTIKSATIAFLKEEKEISQIKIVTVTSQDLDAAKNKATQAINEILNGNWKATVGKHCDKCDYKNICRYTDVPKNHND